ncbi:MAG: hypothetical protein Q7T72_08095 [Bacteroidales bacterium]|nr:hypothetical protein [Bacteroidales bacterium]MDP3003173.1 hypothetical protein [Bacteroidales bacterium]
MRLLSTLIGLSTFYLTGFSQVIDFKNDKYWVDAGFGSFITINNISGLPVFPQYLSINLFNDSTFYKISFLRNEEWDLFGDNPNEEYYSVGVLLGKGSSRKYLQFQFSCGLGITGGIKRGDFLYNNGDWFRSDYYERDKFITPSIPVEIDLLFKPIKYAGIGVTLFGNLNFVRPYCGFAVKLSMGKLR